jgi:protocatechuate 3,4-dioxygenase, beta subunit
MSDLNPYRRETPGTHPPFDYPGYTSTHARAPKRPPVRLDQTLSEITGPRFAGVAPGPNALDLTQHAGGSALGERIIVAGRVLDEDGRPVPNTVVEIWQCNAAGRYAHDGDQHDAPLDPHFSGAGRVVTDAAGAYRFTTIKPGAYPWRNHKNAWRPQHIHYSLFGPGFATRLITQMYFPGDPLIPLDPMTASIPDPATISRLAAAFDLDLTVPEYALGYRWDIVLRGREQTPVEA